MKTKAGSIAQMQRLSLLDYETILVVLKGHGLKYMARRLLRHYIMT